MRKLVLKYLCLYILAILAFGLLYWQTQALKPGLGGIYCSCGKRMADAPNCLYFSVTTISSLGYGDLHPTGLLKPLACAEVLLGLLILGVGIAKILSARTDALVETLAVSQFRNELCLIESSLRQATKMAPSALEKETEVTKYEATMAFQSSVTFFAIDAQRILRLFNDRTIADICMRETIERNKVQYFYSKYCAFVSFLFDKSDRILDDSSKLFTQINQVAVAIEPIFTDVFFRYLGEGCKLSSEISMAKLEKLQTLTQTPTKEE